MDIYHWTDNLDSILSTGRVWGRTEGSVYGTDSPLLSYRSMVSKDRGSVVVFRDTEGVFKRHPVHGPFSLIKRLCSQFKAPMGDLQILAYRFEGANCIVIEKFKVVPHKGHQYKVFGYLRLWGRILGIDMVLNLGILLIILLEVI